MKADKRIRILLADDHEIFRDGFRAMLRKQPSVQLIGEAEDGIQLITLAHQSKPDVIVTDIKMPRMDGIEATRQLSRVLPGIGIIALSMFDEENLVVEMLEAGARGYLLKNAHKDEIMTAIETVSRGKTYYCEQTSAQLTNKIARSQHNNSPVVHKIELSEKELTIMRMICEQKTNKQIAHELGLSIRTVEGYRDRILEKVGAINSVGLVIYAIRNNIFKVT